MSEMIRIALIGCGAIAPAHAEAFTQLPEMQMVAAVNRTLSKAERLAAKYGILDCYSDYRDALDRNDVDAVAILTGNESHREIADAAAAAGKHILLEKPMALTLDDSQAIIDAAERHDVKLMIGQTARYQPVNLAIRAAIDDGEIGTPVYLHVVWNHGMFWGSWRAWQTQQHRSGGHIIHNGVHALDLTAWLLDQPIESVYTQAHKVSSPELETHEDFRMTIRCAGGAIALCELSYALPTRGAYLRTIEVIGAGGRISHSTTDDGMLFHSDGIEFTGPVAEDAMLHQNRDFVRYLQDGGPSPVPGQDGQRALTAALAARRSVEEDRPVRVDELYAGGAA